MQRTSSFPRSENAGHPYLKKKVEQKNQMIMKAKNHNTKGLGEVKGGVK